MDYSKYDFNRPVELVCFGVRDQMAPLKGKNMSIAVRNDVETEKDGAHISLNGRQGYPYLAYKGGTSKKTGKYSETLYKDDSYGPEQAAKIMENAATVETEKGTVYCFKAYVMSVKSDKNRGGTKFVVNTTKPIEPSQVPFDYEKHREVTDTFYKKEIAARKEAIAKKKEAQANAKAQEDAQVETPAVQVNEPKKATPAEKSDRIKGESAKASPAGRGAEFADAPDLSTEEPAMESTIQDAEIPF
jgi:hypothetical protein